VVEEMAIAVGTAIEHVRQTRRPAFLHLRTVRLWGHAGSDAEQGKATFVGVYGLSGAEQEANKAAEKALSALSTVDGDTSGLQELVLFVRHRGH
jgi:hypothetical protein